MLPHDNSCVLSSSIAHANANGNAYASNPIYYNAADVSCHFTYWSGISLERRRRSLHGFDKRRQAGQMGNGMGGGNGGNGMGGNGMGGNGKGGRGDNGMGMGRNGNGIGSNGMGGKGMGGNGMGMGGNGMSGRGGNGNGGMGPGGMGPGGMGPGGMGPRGNGMCGNFNDGTGMNGNGINRNGMSGNGRNRNGMNGNGINGNGMNSNDMNGNLNTSNRKKRSVNGFDKRRQAGQQGNGMGGGNRMGGNGMGGNGMGGNGMGGNGMGGNGMGGNGMGGNGMRGRGGNGGMGGNGIGYAGMCGNGMGMGQGGMGMGPNGPNGPNGNGGMGMGRNGMGGNGMGQMGGRGGMGQLGGNPGQWNNNNNPGVQYSAQTSGFANGRQAMQKSSYSINGRPYTMQADWKQGQGLNISSDYGSAAYMTQTSLNQDSNGAFGDASVTLAARRRTTHFETLPLLTMHTFLLTLLLIVSTIEIQAREAKKPAAEVGQIIKDLEEVHLEETIQRGGPCTLDIQKDLPLSNLQPLYLHPGTNTYWLPNDEGQLQIPRGASIELYCSHSFAIVHSDENVSSTPSSTSTPSSIYARCLHDTTFDWAGTKYELRDFSCTYPLSYVVERMEQPCGDGDYASPARIYRVGYNISAGRFVRTMELCHDADQLRTHYAAYQLLPANEHFQRQVKRVKFSAAGQFSGYDMDRLYSQAHQQQRLAQLWQHPDDDASRDSFLKAGLYLARGHLAAKADLIYASQQRTSFNYLNAAPQWQSFNGGHWATVEDTTRRLVARLGLSVNVYTGTYGVMQLPNVAQTNFHLATDVKSNGVLAVPLLYYRLLIDQKYPSRGLALVGVNNPSATLSQILESYMICNPVDLELVPSFLRWLQAADLRKGYLYACRVSDLANVVGHLPPELAEVNDLLVESIEVH
ncbi:uncharacterized protein LOC115768895 [Drosophila novamexicana]|uniref:uncharacterized protein LOC115768895 n=1 Tax=Drosophila novamexicana TaxID=47314 RepID=UPI0011E5F8DA|nr:uncharacterized protein LOC115768895 [Drosophila novamexicana]